jgi:hypothetical protein
VNFTASWIDWAAILLTIYNNLAPGRTAGLVVVEML